MTDVLMDRVLSLGVGTTGEEDFYRTFQDLSELARNLGASHDYVIVSATLVNVDDSEVLADDGEDLYHDEETLNKVRKIIAKYVGYHDVVLSIINDLQNTGILFRERRKSEVTDDVAVDSDTDKG